MNSEEFRGEYIHSKLSQSNPSRDGGYEETFKDHVISAGLQNSGIINNGGNMNTEKNDGELSFDDLDFTAAGYNSNQHGVEAASKHSEVFRPDTLEEHQQFWGVKSEEQQSRRFPDKAPAFDPQGRRVPDQEHLYDPLGRREVASHDKIFDDEGHTNRR